MKQMDLQEAIEILVENNYILTESQIGSQDKAYKALMKLAHEVDDAGYVLYVVGGAVRDKLMGKIPNDYDLNTNMPGEEFLALSDPGTGRINHRRIKDIAHIVVDGEEFECCILREGDVVDQQRRSDITIGGLIWNPLTDEIIDATGYGKQDIKNKVIRITDFMKDQMLRGRQIEIMWRVFKAYAQFGWEIEPESLDVIKKMIEFRDGQVHVFDLLKERIMTLPHKQKVFDLCKELGIYEDLFGKNPKKLSDGNKDWTKKDVTDINLDNYRKNK